MKWSFSLEIKIRYRDIDSMGHVNNAVYSTYLEEARTRYYMKLTNCKNLSDLGFILAAIKCDYNSPATIEDKLRVYVRPTSVGKTSWTFKYEIRDENSGRLIAEADTIQVAYDYKKGKEGKAKKLDDMLRQKLLADMKEK